MPPNSNKPITDAKIDILHEHYQDTFQSIQISIAARQRYFYLLLLATTVMLFQIYSPYDAENLMNGAILKKIGSTVDTGFLSSIVWFCATAFFIRYAQIVVWLEKQYSYLHEIENHLNAHFGGIIFTREGKLYLKPYPLFSAWASFIYNVFFPILFASVLIFKLANEYSFRHIQPLFYLNAVIFVFLIVSLGLYVFTVNSKKEKK